MKSNNYTILVFLCFLTTALQSQCFSNISTGGFHTIALKPNGTIYSWGNGSFGWGSLGLGNNSNALAPTQLTNSLNNNTIIATGGYNTFVIKSN